MSGAELLAEPSCLEIAGIDVHVATRTEIGGAILSVSVLA